jgi:Holliday junction resolvasome RuvABC endonuclease subunit
LKARHFIEELSMKKNLFTVIALSIALAAAPLVVEAKGKKAKAHTSKTAKKAGAGNFGKPQK